MARCCGVILSITSFGNGGTPLKRMMEVISHKPSLTLSRSGAAAATLRAVSVSAAIAVIFSIFMVISG